MTSRQLFGMKSLGMNLCEARKFFFDWSLGLRKSFFLFFYLTNQNRLSQKYLTNQRRRRSVRTRTIAPSPVIFTSWQCQFSKLKIKLWASHRIQLISFLKKIKIPWELTWNMFENLCWMLQILYRCIAWGDLVLLLIKILCFLQSGSICVIPLRAEPTKNHKLIAKTKKWPGIHRPKPVDWTGPGQQIMNPRTWLDQKHV